MPPGSRSLRLVLRAAGFMAIRALSWSPGVWMSWLLKWTWKPDTPARVPAGARISAGKSGSVLMSLPRMALALVNWVPASCMPSPESPAKRMVAASSSCKMCCGGEERRSTEGFKTLMKTLPLDDSSAPGRRSGAFALYLDDAGVGGQVINGRGKMLDQVMHNPLDGQDAHGASCLIDDRQVTIAAL